MLLGSLRYVAIAAFAKWYTVDFSQRYHNEAHVWSLLHQRDARVVPLMGVYSTEAHPFGLVYECMDGLDLKQYLKKEPNVGRLKLVLIPMHALSLEINPLMLLDNS